MRKPSKVNSPPIEPGMILLDVLRSWDAIHEKTAKTKRDQFYKLKRLPAQVQKQLTVISERLKSLPVEMVKRYSHIPISSLIQEIETANTSSGKDQIDLFWKLCKNELPSLELKFELMYREVGKRVHPLRVCPIGSHWVREHPRDVGVSRKNPDGITIVDGHCRRNRTNLYKDELSSAEMKRISDGFNRKKVQIGNSKNLSFLPSVSNKYDPLIDGWTRYWNDVFNPDVPLPADVVKALLGSESSFEAKPKDQKTKNEGWARGIFQLTDQTRATLKNYKGELKDYYLSVDHSEVYDPEVSIPAGIRWLFYKKAYGERILKKEITWEESIAVYKGLISSLRKKTHYEQRDYQPFWKLLNQMREK